MIITYEQLKTKKPCPDQFRVYCKNFPDNWEVTKAGCLKAAELKLGLYWFAYNFLPAREVFDKATAPAWEAYNKATAEALWQAINKGE